MRAFLIVGLLLLLLAAGAVHVSREGEPESFLAGLLVSLQSDPRQASTPPEPEPRGLAETPAPALGRSAPELVEAGELSVLESPASPSMVRYTDDQGSIHMVRDLGLVPARYRDRAVALGRRGVVNRVEIPERTATAFLDWKPAKNPNRTSVVLYSATWCGACKRAKSYMDSQRVAYEEIDIDRDRGARDELERIVGRVAIPLLQVEGRYISGFRRKVYAKALGVTP